MAETLCFLSFSTTYCILYCIVVSVAVTFSLNTEIADSRIFIIPLTPSHPLSSAATVSVAVVNQFSDDSDSPSTFSNSRETMPTVSSAATITQLVFAFLGTCSRHLER